MKTHHKTSKAQLEVWAWREQIYETVKHLPLEEQVAEIVRQAELAGQAFRARIAERDERRAREAAETAQ